MLRADHSKLKLGRRRPVIRPKRRSVLAYACKPLPPAPLTWDGTMGGKLSYPMLGNDEYGDCTIAALAHLFMTQAANEGRSVPAFADKDVENFYFKLGAGKDEGLEESVVLGYARDHGFPLSGGHKLEAWVAIDPHDLDEVRSCMSLFNGLYIGAELPRTAESQVEWDVVGNMRGNAAPGTWGGHAMAAVRFDQRGLVLPTWGELKRATWEWWAAYVDECYVCLDAERASQVGVDFAALLEDVEIAGGSCISVGSSPSPPPAPDPGPIECPSCHGRMHPFNYDEPPDRDDPQLDPHFAYVGEFRKPLPTDAASFPPDTYCILLAKADIAAAWQAAEAGKRPAMEFRSVEKCPFCDWQTDTDQKNWVYHDQEGASADLLKQAHLSALSERLREEVARYFALPSPGGPADREKMGLRIQPASELALCVKCHHGVHPHRRCDSIVEGSAAPNGELVDGGPVPPHLCDCTESSEPFSLVTPAPPEQVSPQAQPTP
jgi:hypothetical protein